MQSKKKYKTFLYYFNEGDIIASIDPLYKVIGYFSLVIIALVIDNNFLNILISIIIFLYLFFIGLFNYRRQLFKLLIVSLSLFFLFSLIFQLIENYDGTLSLQDVYQSTNYIFDYFSRWLIINSAGILIFTLLSQNELIDLLIRFNVKVQFLISVTIAFNTIGRLLSSLEEINIALASRGLPVGKKVFTRMRYIFMVFILDNIEYISSLRATYAFDFEEIRNAYE
jgi:hypothetical protein